MAPGCSSTHPATASGRPLWGRRNQRHRPSRERCRILETLLLLPGQRPLRPFRTSRSSRNRNVWSTMAPSPYTPHFRTISEQDCDGLDGVQHFRRTLSPMHIRQASYVINATMQQGHSGEAQACRRLFRGDPRALQTNKRTRLCPSSDFLPDRCLDKTTMKKIKDNNALLFMVDLKANKKKINAVK